MNDKLIVKLYITAYCNAGLSSKVYDPTVHLCKMKYDLAVHLYKTEAEN